MQRQQWIIGAQGDWLGKGQEGSLYKFTTKIEQLDGKEQVVEMWILESCFIQALDYTDLDYSDSAALQITVTIRFDHARQSIGGYDAGQGDALGGPGPNI